MVAYMARGKVVCAWNSVSPIFRALSKFEELSERIQNLAN